MLSTLKNLNNRLQKCVGGAKLQANGGALVGATNTMLQARVSGFVHRKSDNTTVHLDLSNIGMTVEDFRKGLLDYSIIPYFDHGDECELAQELLTDDSVAPMVYVGTQDPRYYGVYDGANLRQYHQTLLRDRRDLIDPRTRRPITNLHHGYNAANYRPAYVSGTAFPAPPPYIPPQPPLPPPVVENMSITRAVPVFEPTITGSVTEVNRILPIAIGYSTENANTRFNPNVTTRIRYAIQHFFLRDPPEEGEVRPNTDATNVLVDRFSRVIDIHGLYQRFRFTGELAPTVVDPNEFRGLPGLENYGIIFMRDRPYNHHFQNQRQVMERDMYIDFFVFVLQAYFYTGLTQQRIRVKYNHVNCNHYLYVPYVHSVVPFETRTVIFEVALHNYMDVSQRWLLRIVTVLPGYDDEEDEVNVRQPEFDNQGNQQTFRQAYFAAQQRMMDEAATQRALNEMIGAARSSRRAGSIGNSGGMVESRSGSVDSSQDVRDPSYDGL